MLVMKLRRGESFFVDGKEVQVTQILDRYSAELEVDGTRTIVDGDSIELLPKVWVSVGEWKHNVARIEVHADRSIKIKREGAA